MTTKKIVFISNMAFDANVSIIKELRNYYDVYFFTRLKEGIAHDYGIEDVPEEISCTAQIPQSKKFDSFLEAEKTFLLKDHSIVNELIKAYWNKLRQDILLLKRIKSINPDYVITDNNKHFFTCFHFRKRIIHFKHDPFAHSGEKTFTGKLSTFLLRVTASKYVIFNENQLKPYLQRFNLTPDKVCCSFLSVYEYYHIFDKKNKNDEIENDERVNILFWGRISPYKGIEYLVKGFELYIKQNKAPNIHLIIAGKGDFGFDINSYISKYPNQIEVLNRYIYVEELIRMIQDARFVVCPYTDATQSGVVMTAYAFKKPVLATRVGGLPEMLGYGELGELIEPCNEQQICDGISHYVENPTKLKEYEDAIENVYWGHGEKSWYSAVKKIVGFMEGESQ